MNDKHPRLAVVTGSRVDKNQIRVDIAYINHGAADRSVPIASPHGHYALPKSGDRVVVDMLDDGSVVAIPISVQSPTFDVPDLEEGEFEFRFDDGTALSVRKDGSGSFDVSIEASGSVTVAAAGSVEFGDGVQKAIAREGDTVSVSDPLTGTSTGTITSGSSDVTSS